MFCIDGEVVFIDSKQVDKTGASTLILVSTRLAPPDTKMSLVGRKQIFLLAWGQNWVGRPLGETLDENQEALKVMQGGFYGRYCIGLIGGDT